MDHVWCDKCGRYHVASTGGCSRLPVITTSNMNINPIQEIERLVAIVDSMHVNEKRLIDKLFGFREALERITQDGCGCSPVCRCDSKEALSIWKHEVQDIARAALGKEGENDAT